MVGSVVLGIVFVTLGTTWYHVRGTARRQAIERGYGFLAKALSGERDAFAKARGAFLDAQRASLWGSGPVILLSIVERLASISPAGTLVVDERTPPEVVERRLLRALRRRAWKPARSIVLRLRPPAKQRFYSSLIRELERRSGTPATSDGERRGPK
ncbi:MAG: hypothetical protein KC609_26580 [Myxococcales bacterium]|nr:hypothetical protein [Myxococcales bacterium]